MDEPRVVWYHDGGSRFPAKTVKFHSPTMVDLSILMFGQIVKRTSVPLVGTGGSVIGPYAERPDPANLEGLDLSAIEAAERYSVPQAAEEKTDE